MLGAYNTGEVPFRRLYLHGLIRDPQGRKMTKSLGNVVDPLGIADKYGVDALRFTLVTGGGAGNDFRLFDEKLEGGRNFANKIWNAARFVVQSIGEEKVRLPEDTRTVSRRSDWPIEDRWIVSRVLATAREVNRAARSAADKRRGTPAVRLLLERVRRLVRRSREGAPEAGRPLAAAGSRLCAPIIPPPAPPVHAVRHGSGLAAPARRGRRPGARVHHDGCYPRGEGEA